MKLISALLLLMCPIAVFAQEMEDKKHSMHQHDSVQDIRQDMIHGDDTVKNSEAHHQHHDMGMMKAKDGTEAETQSHLIEGQIGQIEPQGQPSIESYVGLEHAADAIFPKREMAQARVKLLREQGGSQTRHSVIERLEINTGNDIEQYAWESNTWFGGDLNKFWIKVDVEGDIEESIDHVETQMLWSRAIGPWADLQVGLKFDHNRISSDKTNFGFGIHGLARYLLKYDVFSYVSTDGNIFAHIEAETEFHITQRLMFEPEIELEVSGQAVPDENLGDGVTKTISSVRLRYEYTPEFSPYIGVETQSHVGSTKNLLQSAGKKTSKTFFVFGIKLWL